MKGIAWWMIAALVVASCGTRSDAPPRGGADTTAADVSCCPGDTNLAEFEGVATPCTLQSELVSDDRRFRACNYRMTGIEGGMAIVFCGDRHVLGSHAYAQAIAWEPRGTRLLVRDAGPDDDLRLFVLEVGDGELMVPPADRLRRIVGERGDQYRGWEGDTLLLENHFQPGVVRHVGIPPR